ncbi:MAG: STAS domain-containing protein [Rhizobiaceae bacterium]|nr:STAS domain-containing protein [Hyphomicrobiales bacterium]NRB32384.1 STAS domain-containing protein [Rhizobiaceae bacterium]
MGSKGKQAGEADAFCIELPSELMGDYALQLKDEILACEANSLEIDASQVNRIDTPCIEVLLAAKLYFEKNQRAMLLRSVSDQFQSLISVLGLIRTDFETGKV